MKCKVQSAKCKIIAQSLKVLTFALWFYALTFALYAFSIPVYAQSNDIGISRLHPASPLYFLKSAREILELQFAGTTRVKMLRELEFAFRRLREVKALLSVDQDLIEPTMERYSGHISSLPDQHQEKDGLGVQIVADLNIHLQVLEQIYHQAVNPRAKIALRLAINRLSKRADITPAARLSVCRFFSREASASALNEMERAVLTERARKCQISR